LDSESTNPLLLKGTSITKTNPIYIIVGMDKLQLLNSTMEVGGMVNTDLGRLFLHILLS
jgi:hypothetical protein